MCYNKKSKSKCGKLNASVGNKTGRNYIYYLEEIMDNKSFAILGLVLSIVTGIPGLIVSAIALKKYKESGETDGKGFATAGLIIGIICAALYVIGIGCSICTVCLAGAAGMGSY